MAKENNLKESLIDNNIENFNYATWLIKAIVVIIGIILLISSKYAFILFSAGMLPSLVTLFFDRAYHKCATATICTFNLLGLMPFLSQLWKSHSFSSTAGELIIHPITWVVIYSVAFVGFIVYLALPALVAQLYVARANLKIRNLIEHRNKISLEWGIRLEDGKASTEKEFNLE